MSKIPPILKHQSVGSFVKTGPELKIGELTIRKLSDGTIWLEKDDGEGMQMSLDFFEKQLLKIFEENF